MRLLAPILAASLAGCATTAAAPSLAPRAAEAIDPRVPVPEPQLSATVDSSLAARLAELVYRAEAADSGFRAAAASAEQTATVAGARQSESWIAAQQSLSVLTAARGPVTVALADIDALGAERIRQRGGIAAADMRAIQSASARVGEIDRRQAALIDRLQARLR